MKKPNNAGMRTAVLRAAVVAIALLCWRPTASASDVLLHQPGYLYVATFNVYKLGAVDERYRDVASLPDLANLDEETPQRITNLANVLAVGNFHLIVLQEVRNGPKGQAAVSDLTRALESIGGRHYEFFLSGHIGQGLIPEAIAFIYDPDVLAPENVKNSRALSQNIPLPGRDLVQTQWEADDFDFTLISAHLAWGNHKQRRQGFELVSNIFSDVSAWSDDPDVIILGDFNRFGDGADAALALPIDPSKFRGPNIELFDLGFTTRKYVTKRSILGKGVPGDDPQLVSTTVATNRSVYDMILFSSDVEEEFDQAYGKARYGEDFGIIHFDEPNGFGYQVGAEKMSHNALKEAYSDHRPLWARFRMDEPALADD